jgi:hypothetical protein
MPCGVHSAKEGTMRSAVAIASALLLFPGLALSDEETGGAPDWRVYVTDMVNDFISVEIDDTEPVNVFIHLPTLELIRSSGIGGRFAVTVNDSLAWDLAGSFAADPTVNLVPWAVTGADPDKIVTAQDGDADPPVYFTQDYELSMWGNGRSWIYWRMTVTNVQAVPLPSVKLYAWMLSPTIDSESGAYSTGGAGPFRLILNGASGSIGYGPLPTPYPMRYMTSHYVSGNPTGDVDDYIYGNATWTADHPGNDLPNTVETAVVTQEMAVQWTVGDIPAGGSATVEFIFAGDKSQSHVEAAIEQGIAEVPVELASFWAEAAAGAVRVAWVTLSEQNNLGFNVLRSGIAHGTYERINDALIEGAGTTVERAEYEYLDGRVKPGSRYFYKLEQVDIGGAVTCYGPVTATVPVGPSLALEVSPNPSSGALEVVLSLPHAAKVDVGVVDVAGQQVADLHSGNMGVGRHQLRWQAGEDLSPGLYVVEARAGDLRWTRRWVLLP